MTDTDHVARLREEVRARLAAWVQPTFRHDGDPDPHPDEAALVDRLTDDVILPYELKLRAALDELERLRAERLQLGDAEHQWRIVGPAGPIYSFTQRDLDDRANWLPGVRLEQRTVYGTPWVDSAPQQPERGGAE